MTRHAFAIMAVLAMLAASNVASAKPTKSEPGVGHPIVCPRC